MLLSELIKKLQEAEQNESDGHVIINTEDAKDCGYDIIAVLTIDNTFVLVGR